MKSLFTRKALEKFFISYSQLTLSALDHFESKTPLLGDHLGALAHNPEEFDAISEALLIFSEQIKEVELHGRRVRVFRLHKPLEANRIIIPKIEMFEPKEGDNLPSLRYGIEHISFYVPEYDQLLLEFKKNFSFVKEGEFNTSKFAKTEIINNVEIEFRSDRLGEENL